MVSNLSNDLIADDSIFINEFIRSRIPIFVKNMQEVCKKSESNNQCSFNEFCKVMRKFIIPSKFLDDTVLKVVFNNFKEKPEDEKIDYKHLVDKLIDTKDENNFFNFKDVRITYYLYYYRDLLKSLRIKSKSHPPI